jgi:hypothetical protein
MPVAFKNLSGDLQAAVGRGYPDLGQIHYLVDSNFRTGAQGWSRADGTGPLDLWAARNPGYVFRTGDYATDAVAMQAANDALVDFRGDTLFFTPGNYVPAAALVVDVPDARWLGTPVANPMSARSTITAGVAAAVGLTAAADRMEVAFLKLIPITTSHIFGVATTVDGLNFHDFYYDSTGIAANVGTQMLVAAGTLENSSFTDFVFRTDAAQGPLIEITGIAYAILISRFQHFHLAGTLANSLLEITAVGTTGISIGPGVGQIGGGGAVTSLFEHANMTTNTTNFTINGFRGSIGYCTAVTLTPAASLGEEADYVDCQLAADAGAAYAFATNWYVGTNA